MRTSQNIILESNHFRLEIGSDCVAKSLICKDSGKECLAQGVQLPVFSVTQERPFNNEIKLAYPNKRTTFPANALRREGDQLIVGFHLAPYEAVLNVTEAPEYINISLDRFLIDPEDYNGLKMDMPPAVEFRLLQLAIADRGNFGEWLNVSWDQDAAVNVLASAPQTIVDSDARDGYHVMYADVRKDIRMKGPGAALIVNTADGLLDSIASVEEDFGLPKGVASRRSDKINASIYWVGNLTPSNVDEHIRVAKSGGFRLMTVYYTSMFHEEGSYCYEGNYDYVSAYPNGREDLIAVLNKIKAAGITPGLHVLQTHIGMQSRYVTPVADHRLHLTRHFTLAKPLSKEDTTIFVEQDTVDTVMADGCRVLQFGGELITYEGYTTEYPFCFTGCVRGAYGTHVQEHALGQIGGILDVSEYGAGSCYLDQNSSLADEVAAKIADAYNCGFQYMYFDGSEGTNVPFAYHIPNAQYKVYKKLQPAPIFTEGAAKAHFSWHMLSGGNAFDVFPPEIFKAMIAEHPCKEAPRMQQDFTRLDFGWWLYYGGRTQADMYEYGTSRAAAWDCPVTLMAIGSEGNVGERLPDVMEVLRRWEEVRATNWLTDEQKLALQDVNQEHTLLINEQKEFELVPYNKIEDAAQGNSNVSAFSFSRNGESYVAFWHNLDSATLKLPVASKDIILVDELWDQPIAIGGEEVAVLPIAKRRYVKSKLPVNALIQAFKDAELE